MNLALLLLACGAGDLPDGAVVPRVGSREAQVVTFSGGPPTSMVGHRDPDLLLVELTTASGIDLQVVNAAAGTIQRFCGPGEIGMPTFLANAPEIGLWDVVDGGLHIYRNAPARLTSCHADGSVVTTPLDIVSQGTAVAPGGHLVWPEGAEDPVFVDYATATVVPVDGPGAPSAVGRRSDARGLWAVVEVPGALELWEIDAATRAWELLLSVPMEGAVTSVPHVHPDALIVDLGGDLYATGRASDGALILLPAELFLDVLPWPDGEGFAIRGTGVSVDLVAGTVTEVGAALGSGHHVVLDGPLAETRVQTFDRTGEPVADQVVDLSTSYDWLGTEDARVEAFAFSNGACLVARWGDDWGMQARRVPSENGDTGWLSGDTAVWTGPCGGKLRELSRELWIAVWVGASPVMWATHGEIDDEDAPSGADDQRWHRWMHGWALQPDGDAEPLFSQADLALLPTLGGRTWTVRGSDLYVADAP